MKFRGELDLRILCEWKNDFMKKYIYVVVKDLIMKERKRERDLRYISRWRIVDIKYDKVYD